MLNLFLLERMIGMGAGGCQRGGLGDLLTETVQVGSGSERTVACLQQGAFIEAFLEATATVKEGEFAALIATLEETLAELAAEAGRAADATAVWGGPQIPSNCPPRFATKTNAAVRFKLYSNVGSDVRGASLVCLCSGT